MKLRIWAGASGAIPAAKEPSELAEPALAAHACSPSAVSDTCRIESRIVQVCPWLTGAKKLYNRRSEAYSCFKAVIYDAGA